MDMIIGSVGLCCIIAMVIFYDFTPNVQHLESYTPQEMLDRINEVQGNYNY
jgi:hypothetical protein